MQSLMRISFIATCAALVGFALHIVNTYFVNVPILDNWSFVELYEKIHDGTATFADFVHQHNEHRILTARLVFVALAFWTGWDLTYEAYAVIVVLLITFAALARTAFYQRSDSLPILVPLSVLVTCALLFSMIQYGSLLFPVNLPWFMVIVSTSIGIFLLAWPSERLRVWRYAFAAAACGVATFSAANGLSSWLALLPLVVVFARESEYRLRWLVAWFGLFVACGALYFVGYEKPGDHPDIMVALSHPILAIKFFLILLGRPLAPWGEIGTMWIIGGVLCAVYLYLAFDYLRRFGSRLSDEYAPWLSLGLLAIFYAGMVTIGRVGAGEESAIRSDRYMTTTMLLAIALVHMVRLYVCDRYRALSSSKGTPKPAYAVVFLYGVLFAYIVGVSLATVERVEAWSVKTRQYEQCLELVHYAPPSCLREIFPAWGVIKERSLVVERLNFREFAKDLTFFDPADIPEALDHGHIDLGSLLTAPISLTSGTHFELTGRVVRPSLLKPFMVLFSFGDAQPRFFASTRVGTEVSPGHVKPGWGYSSWSATVYEHALPAGDHRIRAWVYDADGRRFVQLDGEIRVVVTKDA